MLITININPKELDELQKKSKEEEVKNAYSVLINLAVKRGDYDRAFELLEERKKLILK